MLRVSVSLGVLCACHAWGVAVACVGVRELCAHVHVAVCMFCVLVCASGNKLGAERGPAVAKATKDCTQLTSLNLSSMCCVMTCCCACVRRWSGDSTAL